MGTLIWVSLICSSGITHSYGNPYFTNNADVQDYQQNELRSKNYIYGLFHTLMVYSFINRRRRKNI